MALDLKITENGELVVGEGGDLAMIWGDDQVAQEVLIRLKTTKGDLLVAPHAGCDLESFIGAPNTSLVHAAMEKQIEDALTYDNLLVFPQIDVTDINENEVYILIEFDSLDGSGRVIQISGGLDLRKGMVFSRINSNF